jgi:hypothetical protein
MKVPSCRKIVPESDTATTDASLCYCHPEAQIKRISSSFEMTMRRELLSFGEKEPVAA